nr:uncharacterized protein LOC104102062 isoform X5 [Nicotiana tomentosiformis]
MSNSRSAPDGYKYSRSAALFIIFKRFLLFLLNMGLIEFTGMESVKEINDDEVKSVIEVMAANGKYWHDWDKLKGMLSFHLKQVLSDYPEAKMTTEQQQSCLGESFPELVKRLDDALNSFAEGPPFTLQRLCEYGSRLKQLSGNKLNLHIFFECILYYASLSSQGRGKVCVYTTLPRPHGVG